MRVISGRIILGLILLALGAVVLLHNFGVEIDVSEVLSYWPAVVLILGLNWLVLSFRYRTAGEGRKVFFSWSQFILALITITIGVVFLGKKFGYFEELDFSIFWSILFAGLLIIAGMSLLRGRTAARGSGRFAFMGGVNEGGSSAWKLESGSYFAFMGGIELDLTNAEIPAGETILDLTAVMGGIDVKVPRGLPIIYEGTALLGGVTFLDHEDGGIVASRKIEQNIAESGEQLVRIQARAFMGGIDIKEKA